MAVIPVGLVPIRFNGAVRTHLTGSDTRYIRAWDRVWALPPDILKTGENYTYLTFAHPVLKPLPASGRGLDLSPY